MCIYNAIVRTITKKHGDINSKPLYINQKRIIKMCNYSTKRQEQEISETKTEATNRKQNKKRVVLKSYVDNYIHKMFKYTD